MAACNKFERDKSVTGEKRERELCRLLRRVMLSHRPGRRGTPRSDTQSIQSPYLPYFCEIKEGEACYIYPEGEDSVSASIKPNASTPAGFESTSFTILYRVVVGMAGWYT